MPSDHSLRHPANRCDDRGATSGHVETPYDLVGIGFGPAGIALAAAIEDDAAGEGENWDAIFLEKAGNSVWQPELLLRGVDIQHHFLRDFATPRNPRSRFTFPNYLKESGRLFDFGLLGGNPGRIEWADYCDWVARQLDQYAFYCQEVEAVEPAGENTDGAVDLLRVSARDRISDVTTHLLARNVILCSGRVPNVPDLFEPVLGDRVFHSEHFLSRVDALDPDQNLTIAVVGSGQSAIEIILYLLDRHPRARLLSIGRNSGFRLYDLGHFSNQVYSPGDVDYLYGLSAAGREALLREVRHTNYASVDADVSRALFLRLYEDRIRGVDRVQIMKRSVVSEVGWGDGRLNLTVEDVYRTSHSALQADMVILCTGYRDDPVPALLASVERHLVLDDEGRVVVERDYRLRTRETMRAGLFVNGLTEATHGISDGASFSMMALKAERTLERLLADRAGAIGAAPEASTAVAS